jgi:membrane-associated phospholipid phosphatase
LIPDPDPKWLLRINGFARDTPWLHSIITAYADYGIAVFAALLLTGWWVARRRGDLTVLAAAVWAPMGALAAVAINQPIVALVAEPRPYAVLSHILVLAHQTSDPSFPSDHAVLAGAVVAGLWVVSGRLGALAVLAAAVMAFARVYIGAHYPHDVLVGLVLGSVLSTIGFWATRPILLRLLCRAEDSRLLRPLLIPAETVELSSQ